MQNSTLIWIIIGALVVLGAGWYLFANQPISAPEGDTSEESAAVGESMEEGEGEVEEEGTETSNAPLSAQVSYSASGFSPSTVTIKKGGTVTWSNAGAGSMWVASAQHPTHTVYSGTNLAAHCDDATDISFDQCKNGNTYSFTFEKTGTWGFHNHSQASHFGTVIVEE